MSILSDKQIKEQLLKSGFLVDYAEHLTEEELQWWRDMAEAAYRETLKMVRKSVAIEYKKAVDEAYANPFPGEKLNKEHRLLWLGTSNGYSEVLSEIDRLLALNKLEVSNGH